MKRVSPVLVIGPRVPQVVAVVVSVVALALCALAPCAFAGSHDEAVTGRYLRANYALVHTADEHVKQIEARLRELVAQIRRECPRVAGGSPKERKQGRPPDLAAPP